MTQRLRAVLSGMYTLPVVQELDNFLVLSPNKLCFPLVYDA